MLSRRGKNRRTIIQEAMIKIQNTISSTLHSPLSFFDLWREYEDYASPESIVVHDLDKFEMIKQAFEYELQQNIRLDSFFDSTKGKFRTSEVQKWDKELRESRMKMWNKK
jgi:5'-deoxynucleotidase YfbR-like HD superfamily hydrolase